MISDYFGTLCIIFEAKFNELSCFMKLKCPILLESSAKIRCTRCTRFIAQSDLIASRSGIMNIIACPLIFTCRSTDPSVKYVEDQQLFWSLVGVSVGSANVHNKKKTMTNYFFLRLKILHTKVYGNSSIIQQRNMKINVNSNMDIIGRWRLFWLRRCMFVRLILKKKIENY